jgi:YfiH family protein
MTTAPFLTSPLLAALGGVRHAFFTREGGVSEGIYASLNTGPGSGDDSGRVTQNRRRAMASLDLGPSALVTGYQVHSADVAFVNAPWPPGSAPRVDGIVTGASGVACGALAADCAPVLIADPEAGLVAAVHAGWRGALAGVVASAVRTMAGKGGEPAQMVAAIGPCIGPASYEVGLEFLETFVAADQANERHFRAGAQPDKRLFDLPGYVLAQLAAAGVTRAEWIGCDTFADEARFFSNRRAVHRGETDYGRLLSAIALA